MASHIIGRTACPECGNASAHVKQSDKCLYRYCPECGAQYFAKTPRQVADLKARTRLTPTGASATATPATEEKLPVALGAPAAPLPLPALAALPLPLGAVPAPPAKPKSVLFGY